MRSPRRRRGPPSALGLDVYGGDAIVLGGGAISRHRPERLAELRPLPPRRRDAHRRAAGRAVLPTGSRPMTGTTTNASRSARARNASSSSKAGHMAPGLQSFALYSGLAMARGRGQPDLRRGRQLLHRLHRRHRRRQRRPLPSALREGAPGAGRQADVRQLHDGGAREVPRSARERHAAGTLAHPALLRRRRGRRGGVPPGQVRHEEARVRRLLRRASTARPAACCRSSGATSRTASGPSCRAPTRRPTPTATAAR